MRVVCGGCVLVVLVTRGMGGRGGGGGVVGFLSCCISGQRPNLRHNVMLLHYPILQGIRTEEEVDANGSTFYTPEQVAAMDPKQIRRVLVQLGLPGAGTPQKLQQRAMAVAEAVAAGSALQDAVEIARRLR